MALLWADGFDDWNGSSGWGNEYDLWSSTSGQVNHYTSGGRRNGGYFQLYGNNDYVQRHLRATVTECFVSVAIRLNTVAQSGLLALFSGSTAVAGLRVNSDGSVAVTRGMPFDTQVGSNSAAGQFSSGAWTHVQMRVVASTSGAGVIQVRINGSTTNVIDLSSQTLGAANIDSVRLTLQTYLYTQYDDFVVNDTSGTVANGWLGDVRVDSYLPNANGDLSQMTGSDGNSTDNYALVNAAAPGSTYVQGSTVGNEDLYGFADMTHNPVAILGVVVTAAALKDDAGTRAIRLHAKSGTTDVRSAADINLGTSRARVYTPFTTDPNTGAAWTKTALNAAQFGFEVTV